MGGTIKDDFELIDVWMLSQRYEEEISETEKEMREYIEGLTTKKKSLHEEILEREAVLEQNEYAYIKRSKIFLLKREYENVVERRLSALKTFFVLLDMNDYDNENDESDDDDVDEGEISDCEIDD